MLRPYYAVLRNVCCGVPSINNAFTLARIISAHDALSHAELLPDAAMGVQSPRPHLSISKNKHLMPLMILTMPA